MTLSLLCVGKLRERFFRDAADEYAKRLRRFCTLEEIEIPDRPEPKKRSDAAERQLMDEEGALLLQRIRPGDYVIALCIEGKMLSSEGLAQRLEELMLQGNSRMVFIIGGSLGLGSAVLQRANERLSFSPMTFPHQLARVMLYEQLYRACKLNAGERYHK